MHPSAAQTLHIAYTDWDDKAQDAWLVDNATTGYTFLTFPSNAASTSPDPRTCVTNKTCGVGPSLKYIGVDGQKYTARVVATPPAAGSPFASDNPRQGQLITFDANGFLPVGATGQIAYQWRFQKEGCTLNNGVCQVFNNDPNVFAWEPA